MTDKDSACYLVLQITAVFIRLPDLFLQLFAPFILTEQLFRQQFIPLSDFTQVLQCGRWFHLHSLGDILREEVKTADHYQSSSLYQKAACTLLYFWLKSNSVALSDKTHLHHWLFASLFVQLKLQLPHSVVPFPQLSFSPPLALFALSLQVWQLLSTLL